MMPVGPPMIEHRLIERMIALLRDELQRVSEGAAPNTVFLNAAVGFFRTYADRCHHGKEGDVLFRALAKKHLSDEHSTTLAELIREHKYGRELVGRLVAADERHLAGDLHAVREVADCLNELVLFYPTHIEKEDKHFFVPIMGYFAAEEQQAVLRQFADFDRKLTHEEHKGIVERWEEART